MSDPGDTWKAWIPRFWWLRGVATALAITALIPEFLDLSHYQVLRVFHAVIVGWNLVAESLGRLIGEIPFLPELGKAGMNTLVLALAVVLPYSASMYKNTRLRLAKKTRSRVGETIFLTIVSVGFPLSFIPIYYFLFIGLERNSIASVVNSLIYLSFYTIFLLRSILRTFPGFGRGLISTILFVATLDLLYFLNTPWLAAYLNEFTCYVLQGPPETCAPTN